MPYFLCVKKEFFILTPGTYESHLSLSMYVSQPGPLLGHLTPKISGPF
jgi:hypothetical protein